MKRLIFLLVCLLLGALVARAQAAPATEPVLKAMVFLPSLDAFDTNGVPGATGVVVKGPAVLQRPEFSERMRPFLGRPLRAVMTEIHTNVVMYCRDHDRPVVDVIYPEQLVVEGAVQIIVLEGRVNRITPRYQRSSDFRASAWLPRTNGWTSPEFLRRNLRLREGDVLDARALERDLDWLARNPQREIKVALSPTPGELPPVAGRSDVRLDVMEQREYQFWGGYDDTGTRLTDLNRLRLGGLWAKAFTRTDDVLSYEFIADPALRHVRAHTAAYSVGLPWRHTLRVFGYYLEAEADLGDGVTLDGPGYQTSFRYDIPLPGIGKYRHEVSVGLDFKSLENTLLFNQVTASDTPYEVFQPALGYTGYLRDKWGATMLSAQFYYSPGDVTPKNDDDHFRAVNAYAEASYMYGRLQLRRETSLWGGASWLIMGSFQLADGNLVPTEQLGLGGYNTIRGYDDRQVNSDEGWIVSNELRSPAFHPLSDWFKWSWAQDTMQVLAFVDVGEGTNIEVDQGVAQTRSLASVGGGLRFTLRRNLEVRFDYGYQLDQLPDSPVESRVHVAATLKY